MRILFCTPAPLMKSLGAAKVVVELAEEMQEQGWECNLVSIRDLADQSGQSMCESLRRYLQEHAADYDVVDYDHAYLPYGRDGFNSGTLFVARSVLLAHHLGTIQIPQSASVKAAIGRIIKGRNRRRKYQEVICQAHTTIKEADLVNVSNDDDKAELIRKGIPPEKVAVIPYGISRALRPLFDDVSSVSPEKPVVAFVGTFDYRKGAKEFPKIVHEIAEQVPDVCFRLLGGKGLFQSQKEILSHFPKKVVERVEVVLKYAPEELPNLLAPCSVGVFPSYFEGMPFGVLEMMAASIPVIAYDAPGPPMMLPPKYLVSRGDAKGMASKVITLLHDAVALQSARIWAKQQSQSFLWEQIACTTIGVYQEHCRKKYRS